MLQLRLFPRFARCSTGYGEPDQLQRGLRRNWDACGSFAIAELQNVSSLLQLEWHCCCPSPMSVRPQAGLHHRSRDWGQICRISEWEIVVSLNFHNDANSTHKNYAILVSFLLLIFYATLVVQSYVIIITQSLFVLLNTSEI